MRGVNRSFAGGDQPLPIVEIAWEAQLARTLPARPCEHCMSLAAFCVAQISVRSSGGIDMRGQRIAVRLQFGDDRFDLDDRFAQVRES